MNNQIIVKILLLSNFLFFSCSSFVVWEKEKEISLGNVSPIGLAKDSSFIWISDGDNNRVIKIYLATLERMKLVSFQRPMHIDFFNGLLYVPEYNLDRISILSDSGVNTLLVSDSMNSPVAIDLYKNEIAIVDFYHHRILYFNGTHWKSIGVKGNGLGELYYPTDVFLTNEKIYVADAYNNRVQVFDKKCHLLSSFGESEKIKVATGIFVSDQQIFVTDFENNRILVYGKDEKLQQIIIEGINQATDVLVSEEKLIVANYKGKSLTLYRQVE